MEIIIPSLCGTPISSLSQLITEINDELVLIHKYLGSKKPLLVSSNLFEHRGGTRAFLLCLRWPSLCFVSTLLPLILPPLPLPTRAVPPACVSSHPQQWWKSDPSLPPVKSKTNWQTWVSHIGQGRRSVATFSLSFCSLGFAYEGDALITAVNRSTALTPKPEAPWGSGLPPRAQQGEPAWRLRWQPSRPSCEEMDEGMVQVCSWGEHAALRTSSGLGAPFRHR